MLLCVMLVAVSDRGHRLDRRCRTICLANKDRQALHLGRHLRSVIAKMISLSQMMMMKVSMALCLGDSPSML